MKFMTKQKKIEKLIVETMQKSELQDAESMPNMRRFFAAMALLSNLMKEAVPFAEQSDQLSRALKNIKEQHEGLLSEMRTRLSGVESDELTAESQAGLNELNESIQGMIQSIEEEIQMQASAHEEENRFSIR